MRGVSLVLLLAVASSCSAWRLVWEDNFDKIDPRKWDYEVSAWGGGNNEFQVYLPDEANCYTKNGILHLKPTPLKDNINPRTKRPYGADFLYNGKLDLHYLYGKCTNGANYGCNLDARYGILPPVASCKLMSRSKFSFKFGRVEIEAKIPSGDWLWPAMWMMPQSNKYGGWPRSGEIDLMEAIGNRDLRRNGQLIGIHKLGSALHWGTAYNQNKFHLTTRSKTNVNNNYADSFHKYVFEWSTNGMSWYVDNDLIMHQPYPLINQNPGWRGFWEFGKPWNTNQNPWAGASNMAPFDQEFYFILNTAVGGTNGYIPDGAVNRGGSANKAWSNRDSRSSAMHKFWKDFGKWGQTWQGDSSAMQLKYIRVFQK